MGRGRLADAAGYQILGFRLKGRGGEIDILARRGRILAVVEVKRRATMEAALTALTPNSTSGCSRRAGQCCMDDPAWPDMSCRIDMVALAPGRFPRHVSAISFPGS
jgi:putative endonuclease